MSAEKFDHNPVNFKRELIVTLILCPAFILWAVFTWINLSAFEEGKGQPAKMNKYLVYLYEWGGKMAVCGFMMAVAIGLAIYALILFNKKNKKK